MKNLDAFQIKIFMAILMVLDHIKIIPYFLPENSVLLFHALTRSVGVWFAYMAVEGFIHTRNRLKYNGRLFFWAVIMLIGNIIIQFAFQSKNIIISNNIFLTLALGVLMLNIIFSENTLIIIPKPIRILFGIIVALMGFVFTEGGSVIIPFILITYLLRDKPSFRNIVYVIMSLFLLITSYVPYDTIESTIKMMMYNSDWLFITVLPFIYLYNGKRGLNNKFSKYFFYVFYPAHLWILATIAYFIK